MSRKNDYKIYNLSSDGWGYLLQYRDGSIYDGFGNPISLGNTGIGTQGPQGPQGPGSSGSQGPQGYQGSAGSQGPQGSNGSQGPTGPQGSQGPTGSQGPQGNQGVQGSAGPQGSQGPQGDQGNQGVQGPTGSQGPQGFQGATGSQGFQGATGSQGLPPLSMLIDNQGSVIPTGSAGYGMVAYTRTITGWKILNTSGLSTGSIVIDIKRNGVSIIDGGNKPTLSGTVSATATISGWTSTTLTANDILEINVDSASVITKTQIILI